MPAELFANNATSTLASSIEAGDTALSVEAGHGARFPAITGSDFFYVTMFGISGTNEINHEVVKVTARATDAFTIVRAQQGTTARAWPGGTAVQLRVTKGTMENVVQKLGDTMSGDLELSGAGRRIKADFSNATLDSRLMLQTSTLNGSTSVGVLPNGTGTAGVVNTYASSEAANSSFGQMAAIQGSMVRITSDKAGSGAYLPMSFQTSVTERLRIEANGNVGIGYASDQGYKFAVNGSAFASSMSLNLAHIFHGRASTSKTPAGSTTWYRLGTLVQPSDLGASVRLLVNVYTVALAHQLFEVTLSKTTTGDVIGYVAKYRLLGGYNLGTYGAAEIRVVDSGVSQPTHIDVRFRTTDPVDVYTTAISDALCGKYFTQDAAMTSQGTGALTGAHFDSLWLEADYDITNGMTFTRNTVGTSRFKPRTPGALAAYTADVVNDAAVALRAWNGGSWVLDIANENGNSVLQSRQFTSSGGGLSDISLNPQGGDVLVTDYTRLGSGAPNIKMKKVTGTTSGSEGGTTNIVHGLTGAKIIGIQVIVRSSTDAGILPEYTAVAGYQYGCIYDSTYISVTNHGTNSENILSKAISVLITYEE